jgi:hypothetical protein
MAFGFGEAGINAIASECNNKQASFIMSSELRGKGSARGIMTKLYS